MSVDLAQTEDNTTHTTDSQIGTRPPATEPHAGAVDDGPTEEDDGEEEDDEEEKLKYAKLTGNLASIYRNGDSTSAFTVGGDKMVVGTHNGNIHVLALPDLTSLRTYHAHQATVTSVSISPIPPPPTAVKSEDESTGGGLVSLLSPLAAAPIKRTTTTSSSTAGSIRGDKSSPNSRQHTSVPNTVNNQIYIATSSLDGHVCVSSLVDPNDVLLRNFARPVQAVALSPDYKNDRTYLSGGLAGSLILTVGGKAGVSSDANTNSAAAAASGWFGSIGLGSSHGKDTVLHSGEGSISTIKWSLSGKWVVWVTEKGIKIMRSHLRLGSEQSEDAWHRIAHADKPNKKNWQDMAGVWRARAEWIDETKLEVDECHDTLQTRDAQTNGDHPAESTPGRKKAKKPETLVVGWGDTAWIFHVREGGMAINSGKRQVGSAENIYKLQFRDCVVSGITMYTADLLAILAYRTRDDNDQPIRAPVEDTSRKGRSHRRTGLQPQLRLIHVTNGEEFEVDELPMSRFESLSAQDYHLGSMHMPQPVPEKAVKGQRGALELMWEVSGGGYAQRILISGASVLTRSDTGADDKASIASPSSVQGISTAPVTRRSINAHPYAVNPGLKLYLHSPYDCALAVKRELGDHLAWLLEREQYSGAWKLVDKHPEIADAISNGGILSEGGSPSTSPSRANGDTQGSLVDFFSDEQSLTQQALRNSPTEREKRRIGDLWLQQLVSQKEWARAGEIASEVLGNSFRWSHWVHIFAEAGKFDEIAPHIPSTATSPSLPSQVYELIMGHYLVHSPPQLQAFMEKWNPELYDASAVISAIESRLESGEVREDTVDAGVRGQNWRILVDCLAKLYLADGRPRDALRCYIRAQNAEATMSLIKEEHLLDAVADDISGLLMLKVTREMLRTSSVAELDEAGGEAIQILVDEAHRGTIIPENVIQQLQEQGPLFRPFIYLYLRGLWHPSKHGQAEKTFHATEVVVDRALVEDYADLAVSLFAEYDRELFMVFLRASSVYDYDKAATICEERNLTPELVYVLSKMGQTKRALFLIIDQLGDVSKAIAFAKENPDLWNDLLDYSMDKPRFIRGLLEEIGTAIDPIDLVRRIPEGLEIEGLRAGIQKIIRAHEIQHSISEGVAEVVRAEAISSMNILRARQKKGVKFEIIDETAASVDLVVKDPELYDEDGELDERTPKQSTAIKKAKPGHCVGCDAPFSKDEQQILIGFACGHVYHLPCLLRATSSVKEDDIQPLLDQLNRGGGDLNTRSVGAKVAHAHIIKNVMHDGCQFCIVDDA